MRQAGGIHRYAEVMLSIENSLGDLAFSWQVSQEQIPDIFKASVYNAVKRCFEVNGSLDGFASSGLLVRILDGEFHETDSNEGSFMIATFMAISNALASRNA